MSTVSSTAVRKCHAAVNALHSVVYFTADLHKELAPFGVTDDTDVYLAGRTGALGPVGPGPLAAVLHGYAYDLLAAHVPALWTRLTPADAVAARLRAAGAALDTVLPRTGFGDDEIAEAAGLVRTACAGTGRSARPLFAAHADLPVPDDPALALWHGATLLREHRGDSHAAALTVAGLDGLEALVTDCASSRGLPAGFVMDKRGWTPQVWAAAQDRLRTRGLLDAEGELTGAGLRLRDDVEDETDRLDRGPYEHLGADGVARLTELAAAVRTAGAEAGVFPAPLLPVLGA